MIPLIYALKSGGLGKNEQMVLETLNGLRDEFIPYIFAPEGAVVKEARNMGFFAQTYTGSTDFTVKFWLLLSASPELGFVAEDSKFSYPALLLNYFYRRKMTHLQIVPDEADGQKDLVKRRRLAKYEVTFVTQSKKTREQLIAQGTRSDQIRVIEKFLPEKVRNTASRRRKFDADGIKKVFIGAVDCEQRVKLLFEALELIPSLDRLEFRVFGAGTAIDERAARKFSNVTFEKTAENLPRKLTEADLYLHLGTEEYSNHLILDALAADLPALVPSRGGEAVLTNNINGFCFAADDAAALAERLDELSTAPCDLLNGVVKGGRFLLRIRFSPENGVEKFRRLINENKGKIDFSHGKLVL